MRSLSKQILLASSILLLLASCGGGGGGGGTGNNGGGGTFDQFSVKGTVFVPSNNVLEVEPNDGVVSAQSLVAGNAVAGRASAAEAGLPHVTQFDGQAVSVTIHDLYKITISEPAQVLLTIAADDTTANDLDLYVLDGIGKEIDRSVDSISPVELVEISKPGTYLIGVSGFNGQSAYTLAVPTASAPLSVSQAVLPVGAEMVPGDIVVKLKQQPEAKSGALRSLSRKVQATGMQEVEDLPLGATLLRVPERVLSATTNRLVDKATTSAIARGAGVKPVKSLTRGRNELKAATIALVQQLRGDPKVEYAEPNFIFRTFAVPNDEFYPSQWHYPLIRLPEAWDITIGESSVIVAVIDSGILAQHPDLQGQLVPGYDFVSDADNAGDGDGRDANPEAIRQFHGVHVAGTIAAKTNNGIGVAGVAPNVKVMPIRALGANGRGDLIDIANAILFAAGLSNASKTLPARRADIVNMSLGGAGYSQFQQDAITAARQTGLIVVAAAGNENTSLSMYPASMDGVISVSAVDPNREKAIYSNSGPYVDVAAPGGSACGCPTGDVWSTWADESTGAFDYQFLNGTSMASPHVAGVIALMKSVNAALTPQDIDDLLMGSHPLLPGVQITSDLGVPGRDDVFGSGLIDAFKAVTAAQALKGQVISGSRASATPAQIVVNGETDTFRIQIKNIGTGPMVVTRVTASQPWIRVSPVSGTAPLEITATLDLRAGTGVGAIIVETDAMIGQKTITIPLVSLNGSSGGGNVGSVIVLALDPFTGNMVARADTTFADGYVFSLKNLPQGTYRFVAATDRDGNDFICELEDPCGELASDVDFPIDDPRKSLINISLQNFRTAYPSGIRLMAQSRLKQ